jgi:GT2 family glycosyltransferase
MMDEEYFLYSEEIDFAYRAQKTGYTSVIVSDTHAIHIGGATEGSEYLYGLLQLNRILYLKKRGRKLSAFLVRFPLMAQELLRFHRETHRKCLPYLLKSFFGLQRQRRKIINALGGSAR